MRRAVLLVVLAACGVETTAPPWSLDHDRVVAVRAEPPHIAPGEIALLEALVAHSAAPGAPPRTTIERPVSATAPKAPAGLFTAVHFYIDHWRIDGPNESMLAAARAELGLSASAPVPLNVVIEVPGSLYAQKTVWLGDRHDNPAMPAVALPATLASGRTYPLDLDVAPGWSVRWLTSCGSLTGDTTPHATLAIDGPCEGELAVVVRDPAGGTTWHVITFSAT
jgi:hypothetical protein